MYFYTTGMQASNPAHIASHVTGHFVANYRHLLL